jgi:hypothetical protein
VQFGSSTATGVPVDIVQPNGKTWVVVTVLTNPAEVDELTVPVYLGLAVPTVLFV